LVPATWLLDVASNRSRKGERSALTGKINDLLIGASPAGLGADAGHDYRSPGTIPRRLELRGLSAANSRCRRENFSRSIFYFLDTSSIRM
jgi:hypothetical protein